MDKLADLIWGYVSAHTVINWFYCATCQFNDQQLQVVQQHVTDNHWDAAIFSKTSPKNPLVFLFTFTGAYSAGMYYLFWKAFESQGNFVNMQLADGTTYTSTDYANDVAFNWAFMVKNFPYIANTISWLCAFAWDQYSSVLVAGVISFIFFYVILDIYFSKPVSIKKPTDVMGKDEIEQIVW